MRVSSKRLALAALAFSALFPAAALAQGPCADGEALLAAGLLDEARTWLVDAAGDPCVAELGEAIAEQRGEAVSLLERARQAQQGEDEVAAREFLAQALALDQSLVAARDALNDSLGLGPSPTPSPTPSPAPYAGAQALAAAGYNDAAKAAAVEVAKARGEGVPENLRYLGDTPWPLLPLQGEFSPAFVALLPAMLVTLLALLLLLPWLWIRLARRRFLVEDLVGPEDAEDVGKQTAVMVEDGLREASREGGGNTLSLVPAPDPAIKLPEEVEALPYGKFVGALLDVVMPPRLTRLQGQLHVADGHLVGATATLVNPRNTVANSIAIWLSDYETPLVEVGVETPDEGSAKAAHLAVQTMAAAIGSWALFALPIDDEMERRRREILTADWQSLAAMRIGALYHGSDKARARKFYIHALYLDPTNTGAQFNLAFLDMADGEWARADTRLAATLERIQAKNERAGIDNHDDRLWYRCIYNLAVTRLHRWIGAQNKEDLLVNARTFAADAAASALVARETAKTGSLRGFLSLAAQASLVVLADAMAARPPHPGNRKALEPTTASQMAGALFNLPATPGANSRLHWPASTSIIAYVIGEEAQRYGLSHRVRYNLACYYAQREHFRKAFAQLDIAFERPELIAYAEEDPTLAPLRRPPQRTRWDAMKAKHSTDEDQDPDAYWWTKPKPVPRGA